MNFFFLFNDARVSIFLLLLNIDILLTLQQRLVRGVFTPQLAWQHAQAQPIQEICKKFDL